MKINNVNCIRNLQGPSPRYYEIMARFDYILEQKIGVKREINSTPYKKNVNSLKETSNSSKLENSLADKIFDYNNKNSSNERLKGHLNTINSDAYNVEDGKNNSRRRLNNIYNSIVDATVPSAPKGLADTSDVRKKSSVTVDALNKKLFGSKLEGMGEHFKRAEDIYGVNAYVLMAIAKLESNWGESAIARDKNNLFGFGAYDSSPYESAKSYDSYEESIYDVAKYLSENYLNKNGKYFNGYSLDGINIKYCTSPDWADKVKTIVKQLTS